MIERREDWKKIYIKNTYHWCDFFSFVSPSGDFTQHLHFWPQNIKCRIGRSYLQEKSSPLLFLETLWSCHGEIGKWKCERTVTLMGRWPKTNVYHIEQGIYRVDHLKRNWILYNITHGVNSSLSIQLWQGIRCPALRRTGVLRIASVLH